MMSEKQILLGPFEIVEDRPFTNPEAGFRDIATLQYMLEKLRYFLKQMGRMIDRSRSCVLYLQEAGERYHRLAISKPDLLLNSHHDLTVVGFCGQRRLGVDRGPIDAIDEELITEFHQHPHLLSYSTLQLECGNSCNLVLFSQPQGISHWATSAKHVQAIEMSPSYYTTIRLHNAILPAGFMSGYGLVLIRTKYYDYQDETMWWAVRELQTSMMSGGNFSIGQIVH